jgi:1-deoxy-D-xylulose-5-phosphate synthase
MEWLGDHGYQAHVTRLGLPVDHFVEHGTVAELQHLVGLDVESIKKAILSEE